MPPYTANLMLLFGSLFGFLTFCLAADPVYTPATLNDTAGNTADSDAVIKWASLPASVKYAAGSPSRISEGLAPYYNMVHGFIDFVFLNGIPLDIVQKAIDGDLGDIPSNYSQYTSYVIGWGVCIGLGILFMIIFPIVACCFCCCRCCCNNCGGKMDQSEKEAQSKVCHKYTYAVVLSCAIAFLVTGAACIYVNNSNTSDALNSISTETKNNVADLRAYVNNTVEQVNHIVVNNFDFLKEALFRDLNNTAYLVGLPIRTDIENQTGIRTTLTNAYTLNDDINTVDAQLADVNTKMNELNASVANLSEALKNWESNLNDVFTNCSTNCNSAPSYNVSTGVDSSQLPDLNATQDSMNSFKATNLTEKIIEAESELDSIPDTVANESLATRNSLKTTIASLSDEIDPVVKEVNSIQDLIYGDNATLDLDSVTDQVEDYADLLRTYDAYRWQGAVGLSGFVVFITLLAALGLLAGILGSCSHVPPSKRGFLSNCGGILLMAFVGFVCIFSTLLMLLTTLTFALGSPMHAWVCKPISDLDKMEEIWKIYNDAKVGEGNYYLGKVVLNNQTIPLTLTGILRDCEAGKSAMEAFKLDTKFDLNDLLNYSKTLDVQSELDAVNVNFTSVTVYPPSLQTQLNDAKNALDVNFTAFYTELNNSPTSMDLNTLADELEAYANNLSDTGAAYAINKSANDLRLIETNEKADTVMRVSALNASVATLDAAVGGIPSQITALESGLHKTDAYITNNGSTVVKTHLTNYANRLLGIVDSFKTFTLDAIQTQMGSCSPIWNVYNTMLVYTFCYNIMDTFNGFWFSLGWCIFFFMPGAIMSVKLARFFRRMNPSNKVGPGYAPYKNGPVVDPSNVPANRKFNASQFSSEEYAHTCVEFGTTPAVAIDSLGDPGVTMTSVLVDSSHRATDSPNANAPSKPQLYGNPVVNETTRVEEENKDERSGTPCSAYVNTDIQNDNDIIQDDNEAITADDTTKTESGKNMKSLDQNIVVNDQINEIVQQDGCKNIDENEEPDSEEPGIEENKTGSSLCHDSGEDGMEGLDAVNSDERLNEPWVFPSDKNIVETKHTDTNLNDSNLPMYQRHDSEDAEPAIESRTIDQLKIDPNDPNELRPSSPRSNTEHPDNRINDDVSDIEEASRVLQ